VLDPEYTGIGDIFGKKNICWSGKVHIANIALQEPIQAAHTMNDDS